MIRVWLYEKCEYRSFLREERLSSLSFGVVNWKIRAHESCVGCGVGCQDHRGQS